MIPFETNMKSAAYNKVCWEEHFFEFDNTSSRLSATVGYARVYEDRGLWVDLCAWRTTHLG